MNISKANIFQVLSLTINPILGLIVSLFFMLKRKLNPAVLAISLGIVSIYLPVMYDVSHSFFLYHDYQKGALEQNLHAINQVASYTVGYLGLEYFHVVLIVTCISLYMWFEMFAKLCEKNKSNSLYITLFFIFILLTTYKEVIDLNRTYLAYMISVYGLFLHSQERVSKKYLSLIFSLGVYFHLSSIIFVLCYLLSNFLLMTRLRATVLLFVTFLFGMLIDRVIFSIVGFLPESSFLSYIVSEKWGLYQSIEQGRILLWFVQFFVIFTILLSFPKHGSRRNFSMFVYMVAILFVFIKFRVFGERFFISVVLMFPLVIVGIKKNNLGIWILLCAALVKFVIYNVYVFGYVFTNDYTYVMESRNVRDGNMLKPFYMPTPFLLAIGEYGYSDETILKYAKRRYIDEVKQ
ncbi:EpsG family protein [Vibrio cholerae]|uniref:EpsG family protein n=1 Tax=Vibrio cholerae TaxID=666 RepID=UPI00215CEE9C|nr:EpsG family protein [Vibrio cholerae]MCR9872836.1 EpsG family protein [Vibrio cholerae]